MLVLASDGGEVESGQWEEGRSCLPCFLSLMLLQLKGNEMFTAGDFVSALIWYDKVS